jgi:hypothetical protein
MVSIPDDASWGEGGGGGGGGGGVIYLYYNKLGH